VRVNVTTCQRRREKGREIYSALDLILFQHTAGVEHIELQLKVCDEIY
jgi:hypothetical protein